MDAFIPPYSVCMANAFPICLAEGRLTDNDFCFTDATRLTSNIAVFSMKFHSAFLLKPFIRSTQQGSAWILCLQSSVSGRNVSRSPINLDYPDMRPEERPSYYKDLAFMIRISSLFSYLWSEKRMEVVFFLSMERRVLSKMRAVW